MRKIPLPTPWLLAPALGAATLLSLACNGKQDQPAPARPDRANVSPAVPVRPALSVPVSATLPEGVWIGTCNSATGEAHPCQARVLAGGEFQMHVDKEFVLAGILSGGELRGEVLLLGREHLPADRSRATVTLRVTEYHPGRNFLGTLEYAGKHASFHFDSFAPHSSQPLTVAQLAGDYSGESRDVNGASLGKGGFRLTLGGDASVRGQSANGVTYAGTFSIPRAQRGIFKLNLTVTRNGRPAQQLVGLGSLHTGVGGQRELSFTAVGQNFSVAADLRGESAAGGGRPDRSSTASLVVPVGFWSGWMDTGGDDREPATAFVQADGQIQIARLPSGTLHGRLDKGELIGTLFTLNTGRPAVSSPVVLRIVEAQAGSSFSGTYMMGERLGNFTFNVRHSDFSQRLASAQLVGSYAASGIVNSLGEALTLTLLADGSLTGTSESGVALSGSYVLPPTPGSAVGVRFTLTRPNQPPQPLTGMASLAPAAGHSPRTLTLIAFGVNETLAVTAMASSQP